MAGIVCNASQSSSIYKGQRGGSLSAYLAHTMTGEQATGKSLLYTFQIRLIQMYPTTEE